MLPGKKYRVVRRVYKCMTITIEQMPKSHEMQSGQGKKKIRNVDILSASCLIFATESGYFSTLAPIITV